MADTPFQPAQPPLVEVNDALADLEADFAATTTPPEVVVIQEEPPPIGRSFSFDFTRSAWRTGRGNSPLTTNGLATLIQWAEKCLHTARGAHPIHPPGYGLRDPLSLIGQLVDGAPVAELESRIREALTFHPRISDIRDFDYDFDSGDEWVAITFTMVLDDDTLLPMDTNLSLTTTAGF